MCLLAACVRLVLSVRVLLRSVALAFGGTGLLHVAASCWADTSTARSGAAVSSISPSLGRLPPPGVDSLGSPLLLLFGVSCLGPRVLLWRWGFPCPPGSWVCLLGALLLCGGGCVMGGSAVYATDLRDLHDPDGNTCMAWRCAHAMSRKRTAWGAARRRWLAHTRPCGATPRKWELARQLWCAL